MYQGCALRSRVRLVGGPVFGGEPWRGRPPCSTPHAEFAGVGPHPGVLLDRRGHRFVRLLGAFTCRAHVEVVEVGDHKVVCVQVARAFDKPVVLAKGEKRRHERVALFSLMTCFSVWLLSL